MQPKFELGDIVKISRKSEYYGRSFSNPKDIEGEVVETDRDESLNLWVHWDNGSGNSYRDSDLRLVRKG